jgi:hypothetical protein
MLGSTLISKKRLEDILVQNADLKGRNEDLEIKLKTSRELCVKLFNANCKMKRSRDEKGRFIKKD